MGGGGKVCLRCDVPSVPQADFATGYELTEAEGSGRARILMVLGRPALPHPSLLPPDRLRCRAGGREAWGPAG